MATPGFNVGAASAVASPCPVSEPTVLQSAGFVCAAFLLFVGLVTALAWRHDLDVESGATMVNANDEGRSVYSGRSLGSRSDATMYDFGWTSYLADVPANANPYEHGHDRALWLSGWIEAKRAKP